ncbi:MAG: response regulator transcription factor [Phenylobacterium sp.]|uniref:response regulator transcription factor n=1 Tax=Phenylobacterium sp. TaxID=1871053 RepID=UPI0025F91469|nr:response regulator transcription factor [Phenylobacterium sp.]MCA3708205.1 response regulator transcription factor [Phenylobacterium sp.]MCA3713277.1 response regulator transcription factor [Phenylobacterium sp.]MCA3716447.1 response regulator transcription factor [Phenylobacterium sp.]MCA3722950.1 response regulator transcription factor [Phenylobacterium sp.]MCA3725644.1 response regulator transcription factor [Phenylobacterium sp.]
MAQPKTLLIVDDNDDLRTELADLLASGGEFTVHQAADGAAGVRAALESRPDLILLDVDLPDTNGREVCRELRARQVACPVIMLTAADTETEMVGGLDAGANDYVTKPFKLAVLQARIRAQLRSHEHSEGAVFRLGPFEFRPAAKVLVDASGRKIRLTEKETNILKYLYRAGDKPVPREELLAEVWGYNAGVTTHTLETHVYRLRQKIENGSASGRLILTEGGGYRLAP